MSNVYDVCVCVCVLVCVCVCVCVHVCCVVHWHCSAQLSMFNMEKHYRNKIIIIIIMCCFFFNISFEKGAGIAQ